MLILNFYIFLDTYHDGGFEREFILALLKNNYKGMVLCDDIYLNNEIYPPKEYIFKVFEMNLKDIQILLLDLQMG
jgi:hypothetical protein